MQKKYVVAVVLVVLILTAVPLVINAQGRQNRNRAGMKSQQSQFNRQGNSQMMSQRSQFNGQGNSQIGAGRGRVANSPVQSTSILNPTNTEITESTDSTSSGELLFNQFVSGTGFSCQTCHYPNSDNRLIGPGLLNVEERFETYDIAVENLESYIKQSIVDPNVFIAPNELPFVMPQTYGAIFTDDELDSLVDYILSS